MESKYLHLFDTFNEFNDVYSAKEGDLNYNPPAQVTVTGGTPITEGTQGNKTNAYNGTYNFVSKVQYDDGGAGYHWFYYTNGTYDLYLAFDMGDNEFYFSMALIETNGNPFYSGEAVMPDLAETPEITTSEKERFYEEPWVSCTKQNMTITLNNGKTYKYFGQQEIWMNAPIIDDEYIPGESEE